VLTGDLARVRRVDREIVARFLTPADRRRLVPVAAELVQVVARSLGVRRDELLAALDEVPSRPADRRIVLGLQKLLLDRCELASPPGPDAVELRRLVFGLAAVERRSLGPRERFDRERVLRVVGEAQGLGRAELEEQLFADLEDNERLLRFRALTPEELLGRYDLALAQAVLLQSTRVTVELGPEDPRQARALFRAARFHGLLHRVLAASDGGYRVELDGPLSLFSAVKSYGLKLALFLPTVVAGKHWRLSAELAWGRAREPTFFRLGPEQGLAASAAAPKGLSPALRELCEGFAALGSRWTVEPSDRIFALPGEVVCVPDLLFSSRETGEQIYLEAFGFWSRAAVWQRIETIARGSMPARLILAVSKQLRVSEELLGEQEAGELYVYRTRMSPRAILDRLERR
jgi:predicted nuclease of restriction endonuclease-like RecB superfamily